MGEGRFDERARDARSLDMADVGDAEEDWVSDDILGGEAALWKVTGEDK